MCSHPDISTEDFSEGHNLDLDLDKAQSEGQDEDAAAVTKQQRPGLLLRALHAALPILLLLLLLMLAMCWLVPRCEDEYSCVLHNMRPYFWQLVLNYKHGPPPQ